jgi:hypothetical protein
MTGNTQLVPFVGLVLVAFLLSVAAVPAQERLCDPTFENCRYPLWQLIDAETVGIDVAFWYLTDASYVAKLIDKHNAGVPVRVIVDPRANLSKTGNASQLAALQSSGIPMRYKSSPFASGGIMHMKFMIFAGQNKLEFGSANYSPYSFVTGEPYVDYTLNTIYFTDDLSIVNSFKTKFDDLWTDTTRYANYANVTGSLLRRYPTYAINSALNFPPGAVGLDYDSFAIRTVAHLNQENQKIDVIMFRLSDQRLSDAVINAVNRNVPVRLMTEPDEYRARDRLWHSWHIDRLYAAGIPIKHRKHRGEQHNNSVIAYGQGLAIFGSSSWAANCSNVQEEHNYFTTKPWILQWLITQFEAKWNAPAEYEPFVPLPPDQPTNQAPASGAVGQATNLKLIWQGGPWAHKYDIYFGTAPNPPLIASDVTAGSPEDSILETYNLPALALGTTYYWRIVGKTMANLTANGPTWSFTTTNTQPPPNPVLQSISPTSGTGGGGTLVTVSGANFLSGAIVTMGGTLATDVTVLNSSSITATTPAHGAGLVDIAVINANGQAATLAGSYNFSEIPLLPAPTVTAVSPNSGTTAGGTTVTISGLGFSPGSTVSFGGASATNVVVNSYTSITATAPAHSAGAVNITVNTPYELRGALNGGFSYTGSPPNPAPAVNTIYPNSGTTSGGTSVTITGTGFLSGASVTIGGALATNVNVVSSTSITATTPAHAAGMVNIIVTNSDTQSSTLTNGFTYSAATSSEVVLYAVEALTRVGAWQVVSDATAAGGARLANPDAGAAKINTALTNPAHYFEMTFTAEAGRGYRLWLRGKAQNDDWGNDSVHVQFSDSVDSGGTAVYRIGKASSTVVALEDCSGCGLQGWGWQDNGWGVGVLGPLIYFQSTGQHTIRIQVREDGFSIDQIVLSGGSYLNVSPGSLKNDNTILPKSGGGPPPAPSVNSILPSSGSTGGGTVVTITGAGFLPGATVTVGGTAGTNVTVSSSTSITATTPAHAAGLVNVMVTNTDGQSGTLVNGYNYASSESVPQFGHVFVLVEENQNYSSVIGSASMPYLNSLASRYGLATSYYANTHPSIGNYFWLTTGQNITNDSNFSGTVIADNIVRQLVAAGKTWKSYAESLPSVGYTGGNQYPYVKRHNPFAYLSDVLESPSQANNIVPFSQFATDLANNQLPNYSFIIPNQYNNSHDCPPGIPSCTNADKLSTSDNWLSTNIAPLLASPAFQQNGLLIITYDEASSSDTANGGGRIVTVVISPRAKPSYSSTTFYQHQSTLRMTAEALGLTSFPGASATAANMLEFFDTSTSPVPAVNGISPNSGTTAGGTSVTITGSGFTASPTVMIGGLPATNVNVVNSNNVTANTPAHALGSVNVVVTNTNGQSGTLVNGYTYTSPASFSLAASPSTVNAGQTLNVTWTAPSGRPANDWIGLYKVGDPETSFISWQYTGGAASGSTAFTAPNQAGQYEFRYFTNNTYNKVATSNTVTVSAGSGTFSLTASPSSANAGQVLTVAWTAPSGRPANDWIGLYRLGDPETSYISWQYTGGAPSGNTTFTAPSQAGQYEFRYFTNNSYNKVATSNAVSVTGTAAYSVAASPGTANPGQTLNVTWTAPNGRPADDWIGLYKVGDPDTSFISWKYTGGAPSGSTTFTAPSQPGQYEFRYFLTNGYTKTAQSNVVTVN